MTVANQPHRRFQAGPCVASIFMSEQSRKDGQPYARVILQRIYRDEQGKFHGTSSFRSSDIPLAVLVLGKAYDHLVTKNERL